VGPSGECAAPQGVRLTKPKSGGAGGGRPARKAGSRRRHDSPTPPESTLRFTQFAVDNLSDAAYWIEQDARITYVNEAACRLTGYTRDELLGMFIYDLNAEMPRERWPEVWHNLKRAGKRTFETTHRKKGGQTFPVEIAANYLEFDGKEYSCAFARDITDRRLLESRLRQAEKMEAVGQLAGGIAHDFNNQLMAIMGYADVLDRRLADAPELATLAQSIRRSALRAAELTTQLLAFSRRGVFVPEPLDLHRIVADVIDILSHTLDKRIVVLQRLEAERPFTLGDATQLQSATLNLALNARDAMPEGGTLMFSTTNVALDESFGPEQLFPAPSGDYVRLTVSDTGEGIDAETQERIFEPFFTTKGEGEGTGLGLAVSRGIVEKLGGRIEVDSRPGEGCTFRVVLPRRRP
jgi:two-component system cell cycle sensor histidine kinase/response regulator CckA